MIPARDRSFSSIRKPAGPHVRDRAAGKLALASGRREFHRSLDPVDRSDAAANVVDQDQPSAVLEHTLHLQDRSTFVGHAAHGVGGEHRIEHAVWEREILRVSFAQRDPHA
jgi:hypothetical protein